MSYIKPDRFLTLTEFRATGRDVNQAELEEAAGTDLGGNEGGRVYVGSLYIERAERSASADGCWCLVIMNESWLGPLRTLEALLYAYARTEILPKPADEQAAMIDEWRRFCRDEGLACVSADEMPTDTLSGAQRSYVYWFRDRWESMERRNVPPADRVAALEFALRNMLAAFGNLSPSNPAVTHARWVLGEKKR